MMHSPQGLSRAFAAASLNDAHGDAAESPLHALHADVQRQVIARVIDGPIRDGCLAPLGDLRLVDKNFHTRVHEAIAERLRNPTDGQRDALNDREMGFAASRSAFEALKSLHGDEFRDGLRELLAAHRHVEISFVEDAFAPETNVFDEQLPSWPPRPVLADERGMSISSIVMREQKPTLPLQTYQPPSADQRRIVIEELGSAADLANLRLNASCPHDFKDGVLKMLDGFAERTRGSARPRIELAFHQCTRNDPGAHDTQNTALIDERDWKRLAANPLIARLELAVSPSMRERPVIDLAAALDDSSLETVRLVGYNAACSPLREGATFSKLGALSFDSCHMNTHEDCEAMVSRVVQAADLKALEFARTTCTHLGELEPAFTPNVAALLEAHASELEQLSVPAAEFGDAGLRSLLNIESLTSLNAGLAGISSASASAITEHPRLSAIDLTGNRMDDTAASSLIACTRLRRIDLKWNSLDGESREQLGQQLRPGVRI